MALLISLLPLPHYFFLIVGFVCDGGTDDIENYRRYKRKVEKGEKEKSSSTL